MAKARNNATDLMSGKVDQFVFRDWFGETVVSKKPKKSRKQPSAGQQETRTNFKLASRYAKWANDKPELKAYYLTKAKGPQNAYVLAFEDFFSKPEIKSIETDRYLGSIGGTILIDAFEQFKVAEVKVRITSADGTLIEEGNAVPDEQSVKWKYTSTVNNASLAGCIITVTAFDLPGNSTVETKTL
jgi:hypothetical protein